MADLRIDVFYDTSTGEQWCSHCGKEIPHDNKFVIIRTIDVEGFSMTSRYISLQHFKEWITKVENGEIMGKAMKFQYPGKNSNDKWSTPIQAKADLDDVPGEY